VLGANGSWEEVDALGIARFTPGARIRALEEAIIVVRALACGGEPVAFDGEFYKVTKLMPAAAPNAASSMSSMFTPTAACAGLVCRQNEFPDTPARIRIRSPTRIPRSRLSASNSNEGFLGIWWPPSIAQR
jgi:hypothetical protein